MSLLAPFEDIIHKLDTEAAAEVAAVKADAEARLGQVLPVVGKLKNSLGTIVTAAAEAATPGLTASVLAAVAAAESELKSVLGL